MKFIKKGKGLLIAILMLVALSFGTIESLFHNQYAYYLGQHFSSPALVSSAFQYELKDDTEVISEGKLSELHFDEIGNYHLGVKFLGLTVKEASLSVYPSMELVPGGQSVGMILKTSGVVIVGFSAVAGAEGEVLYPAKEAGITLGDSILKIDGNEVTTDDEALTLIDQLGKDGDLDLEIRHGDAVSTKTVKTYLCPETGRYRLGLYIRDNTGGIGTLTFYDAASKRYGALGHPIAEAEQGSGKNTLGRVLSASVNGIKKAEPGETGEKIGYFDDGGIDGTIDTVSSYGVFGTLDFFSMENTMEPLEPARPDEIKKGKAQIITVLEGNKTEFFDIEILDVIEDDDTGKGLYIEVTDQKLLDKTGGIIQGMSGSPIIQNNKIIGAVTYVMVDRPNRGFGCLIGYMLEDSAIPQKAQ
ncbi:MAG: SpoIVB peptidase [Bacillota bacterium]|nr:SpoIVB peptidase [Bacillota bacterium]